MKVTVKQFHELEQKLTAELQHNTSLVLATKDLESALETAKSQLKQLNEEAETLKKEASANKNSAKYYSEQYSALHKELEDLHIALDAVPDCPPRVREAKYGEVQVSAMARLVGLFANRR